jgi:hypothetical protein
VSADSNTSSPTGGTAKQSSTQVDVHLDTDTFFGAQQDDNDDGQVSEEEFVHKQGVRGAGAQFISALLALLVQKYKYK